MVRFSRSSLSSRTRAVRSSAEIGIDQRARQLRLIGSDAARCDDAGKDVAEFGSLRDGERRASRRGVEFLLTYRADRGDKRFQPYGTSYLWRQVSFPLFYQADVLFVLRAIDAAGAIDDPRAQSAIAWLLSRQDERGRWGGRSPYSDRMPSKIDSSKWVTLQAITLLKHAFPGTD